MSAQLSPAQWSTAIEEADPPTFGEVVQVLEESDVVDADPRELVEAAIATGEVVEGENHHLRLEGAETDPEDTQTPGVNPGGKPVETTEEKAQAALESAIEFYHRKLDEELPEFFTHDTPREYYREGRGWDEETIEDKRLGYAPPNSADELLAFLHERGHDRADIIASGIFGESGDGRIFPYWTGRFVLPYFDADRRPVFAISRRLGEGHPADWAGRYGEDDDPAKYHKLSVSRDGVLVEEPIYGLSAVRDGEPVLVTEGIADAITAHQAGFPAISPVTTTFKRSDREDLLEVLEERGVPRVYIAQDAERPGSDLDEEDRLTLPQHGEGLRGAVNTGAFLVENGVDARVAELPRAGLDKVDLDDYLLEWDGDLSPVLAGATPAKEHPAYDPPKAGGSSGRQDRKGEHRDRPQKQSALYDLDITDVTGFKVDDRGKSPLGHHGDSEDYFYVYQDDGDTKAVDHKYGTTYTPLTYLLADTPESTRSPDDPGASLDDEEVFVAWKHAKDRGDIPVDDPAPSAALRYVALDRGFCEREEIDDGLLPREAYNRAIEAIEEAGYNPGRTPLGSPDDEGTEEYRTDPTEVDVVLEPKRAWDAAGRVTPEDLDDQPLDPQGDGWVDPRTGEVVGDVVRAVAIAEYPNVEIDTPLGDRYAEAYRVARDRFDAPLPEYLTHADAVERFDYVIGAVRELTFWHLDEDALNVEITGRGGDVSGEAELTLDPSPLDGWRDSESGESVLVFPSGTVYDVDLGEDGKVVDVLRFVAVDAGLLDDPTGRLEGEDFTEAYRIAREDYGAPLPRWDAGTPDVTPILPPTEDFVDLPEEIAGATERLDELRQDTEALYRDAIEAPDEVDVLNVLPALGKTTAAIKTAADKPTTYLAARKDLMAQAAAKAEAHGASYLHLPVFAEANLEDTVVDRGVEAVRDGGMHLLRDRWNLLDAVGEEELDIFDEGEEDEDAVELDRATCPTAEGDHGDAWALAVHVAHALDYTPRDIHERAEALFGTSLPCQGDEGDQCEYSHGWDEASDPDEPIDLLIGYYTHAHVESARTYYERSQNGRVRKSPRGVVLDEFPGRSFTETFDEDALDHAVWLASALTDTVDDRQDLLERDVWDDDLVRLWLKGEAAEEGGPTHDLARSIGALRASLEAAEAAEELLDGYGDLLESRELAESVRRVRDDVVDLGRQERAEIAGRIATEAGRVPPDDDAFGVLKWLDDDVATPLANSAGVEIQPDADALPEGELRRFVEDAVEAADNLADGAAGMLRALEDALAGGDDGARELSVFADDGYAHRKAHYLLEAAVRPPQDGDVPKIATESFTFGTEDGTTLKHVRLNDRVRVVLDRNSRGAEILQPFSRTAGGGDVPVVGLDATARRRLWEEAIGADVRLRDVHDSPTERAETLRDVHDLQIVQTSDLMKAYEGDPSGKNLDADVALLEEITDKFSGVIPGDRDEEADVLGKPAAITTKVVRQELEDDERLVDAVDRWENYGNLKGANDLGEHRLAALLGSQHYGDAEIERFAALAGEEIERTGYGSDLDYRSGVANEYLRHMREDQVMQAALRFARGDSGAVVFSHTAALRDDLPVVGRGEVVRSWSETATTIAKEWRRHPGEEFTVADVADAVDVGKRQVRRVLEEFVDAGYLERHDPGAGLANEFTARDRPGAGEVEIGAEPSAPRADPGRDTLEEYYTVNVRVVGQDDLLEAVTRGGTTPLPAPNQVEESIATGDPPN